MVYHYFDVGLFLSDVSFAKCFFIITQTVLTDDSDDDHSVQLKSKDTWLL